MPAAKRNAISELFFKVHPWLYRKSGGKILGKIGPSPILLLNTRGRKSGLPRTNGLVCMDRGDHWVVAASWAGEPKHPVWYLNLRANPEVTIELGGRVIEVRAKFLDGAERDLMWQELVAQDPSFAEYEERTRGVREIPIVLFEPRQSKESGGTEKADYTMYGTNCSYFTGKLEAYMRAKGIAFDYVEMNQGLFEYCGQKTGIVQLPCIETATGEWLTDTTPIIQHFEQRLPDLPAVTPQDDAVAYLSYLLEDLFDEWFWRPALYYRWAFDEDAQLMSRWLAKNFNDSPLPLFLQRRLMLFRQRTVFLKRDGVTKQTAPAIEALYKGSLAQLDKIFRRRSFLFGNRPCEADFGLFGPFFRHFFCDPTPGAIMLAEAPYVAAWVTRMWTLTPDQIADMGELKSVPDDLDFFFEMIEQQYFPYLEANGRAFVSDQDEVRYSANGTQWRLPTAPYRVQCFNELKTRYLSLGDEERQRVQAVLPNGAIDALTTALTHIPQVESKVPLGRLGRPAATFG